MDVDEDVDVYVDICIDIFQEGNGQWETVLSICHPWNFLLPQKESMHGRGRAFYLKVLTLHRKWSQSAMKTQMSLFKVRSWRCFYWYMISWLGWNSTLKVSLFLINLRLRSSCHSVMEFVASVGWLCGNVFFSFNHYERCWSLDVINGSTLSINSDIWYHLDFEHSSGSVREIQSSMCHWGVIHRIQFLHDFWEKPGAAYFWRPKLQTFQVKSGETAATKPAETLQFSPFGGWSSLYRFHEFCVNCLI